MVEVTDEASGIKDCINCEFADVEYSSAMGKRPQGEAR